MGELKPTAKPPPLGPNVEVNSLAYEVTSATTPEPGGEDEGTIVDILPLEEQQVEYRRQSIFRERVTLSLIGVIGLLETIAVIAAALAPASAISIKDIVSYVAPEMVPIIGMAVGVYFGGRNGRR